LDRQKAFKLLRESFTFAPILKHRDGKKPFIIETDTSNFVIDAILSQEFDGKL